MTGNVDSRTEVVDATGVIKLPNANFLALISATANVAIKLQRAGMRGGASQENYSGSLAGVSITRRQPWDFCYITAAAGTTVVVLYGTVDVRDDDTKFNQQIATISGVTAFAEAPSATFVDTVDTAQATATQTAIAANLLRRRITIGVRATAAEAVRVSFTGGAGRGIEIQPGMFQEFKTTAALFVRNDNSLGSGLGTTWYAEEES